MHLYLSKVECHHSFFYFIFLISRVVLILLKDMGYWMEWSISRSSVLKLSKLYSNNNKIKSKNN